MKTGMSEKQTVIFAGTTEGRRLSECLALAGIVHTVCVATEYGEVVLPTASERCVHCGRMNQKEMEAFFRDNSFSMVVDATHPFARDVTDNIRAAVEEQNRAGAGLSYLRLVRDEARREGDVAYFESNEACQKALADTEGNILLTTGSKELPIYCGNEALRSRLYVRVLPAVESIQICRRQGLLGRQILAMQGPFTQQMNEAVLQQYQIRCLVTKESGASGGYPEKLAAARQTGVKVFVIGRPPQEGASFSQVCQVLEALYGRKLLEEAPMEITLAGLGMGSPACRTREVEEAIDQADILLGAERMLAHLQPRLEKRPYYRTEEIMEYLREVQDQNCLLERRRVVVLFSGDSGFYSGCQSLYLALQEEIRTGGLQAVVRVLPGISSVAYLAACIGESYQDAAIYSMHGKTIHNLAGKIGRSPKTFLLTSGAKDIRQLGQVLTEAGMSKCQILAGAALSYDSQQLLQLTPAQCMELWEEGLYTCFVRNPYAASDGNPGAAIDGNPGAAFRRRLTHGMADTDFIREKVPMTKEEVRSVSICKLRLTEGSVVYDIGSGTGSVAVEIARLSEDIEVYALEQKAEAAALIGKNRRRFHLYNLTVIHAKAPDQLDQLPAATHAFIGGSGGKLREILSVLRQRNQEMRVVINAISLETICELRELLSMGGIKDAELVQLQASRSREAGSYHLMQAENPVWICSFTFAAEGDGQQES